MSDRYKHIENGDIVKIVNDNGKFYTLNNGVNIDKQLFANKYSIINDNVNIGSKTEIDPNRFLNQQTNYQKPKVPNVIQNTQTTPTINENISSSINPDDFFNSSNINIQGVDSLQQMDTSRMVDVPESQRTQIIDKTNQEIAPVQNTTTMEEEKRRLLEKYSNISQPQQGIGTDYIDENNDDAIDNMMKRQEPVKVQQPVNENGLTDYQESFRQQQIELTGTDPYAEKVRKYREAQRKQDIYDIPLNSPKTEQVVQPQPTQQAQPQPIQEPSDPVYSFFKSAKRSHTVNIKLDINTKIGKPEFIKMMSENLDGDFIKYYAEDILKEILSDVPKLEKIIYDQVYKEIYGEIKEEEIVEKIPEKKNRIIPEVPKEERAKLDEGVEVEDVIVLIPGKKTKTGKQTFKFINNKGIVVDMLPKTAENKGYRPASKKDIN